MLTNLGLPGIVWWPISKVRILTTTFVSPFKAPMGGGLPALHRIKHLSLSMESILTSQAKVSKRKKYLGQSLEQVTKTVSR